MVLALLILGTLLLAWSNGANDNFKGVATLYGSNTASFRRALIWATAATAVGAGVSVTLARSLAVAFSGKGLVPDSAVSLALLAAVGAGAAITILLATRLGMPTSTTHALTGALVGGGLAAAGFGAIDWARLGTKFAQPLLISPVLAIAVSAVVYPLLRTLRRSLGVERETCVCVGEAPPRFVPLGSVGTAAMANASSLEVGVGELSECVERYQGRVLGVDAQRTVDAVHYASGAAVCFARAVNDTPKIAALLLASGAGLGAAGANWKLAAVATAVVAGGWLHARRVAETMSKEITDLNPGQGLTANLITSGLVLGASRLGLPVSTTHVSCGAIFGIAVASRSARWRTIGQILLTWMTTLPLALVLGALFYRLLTL